jgi:hypothetical protein
MAIDYSAILAGPEVSSDAQLLMQAAFFSLAMAAPADRPKHLGAVALLVGQALEAADLDLTVAHCRLIVFADALGIGARSRTQTPHGLIGQKLNLGSSTKKPSLRLFEAIYALLGTKADAAPAAASVAPATEALS